MKNCILKTTKFFALKEQKVLSRFLFVFLLVGMGWSKACFSQTILPVSLRCEYKVDPIGIDNRKPALNWLFESVDSSLRGQKQTSYQVLVASSPEILSRDIGNLWNSGMIDSDQSTHVFYEGTELKSLDKCFWKVRVKDELGNISKWSKMAKWQMGLLDQADWQGNWIGMKEKFDLKTISETGGYSSARDSSQDVIKWVQIDLGEVTQFNQIVIHPTLPVKQPDGQTGVSNPGFGFPVRFRVDVSNDLDFKNFTTLIDYTDTDFPNPGLDEIRLKFGFQNFQYVRLTATKLWDSGRSETPFLFCLGEIQVISDDKILSLNKTTRAFDSIEEWGWSKENLTDGINLAGGIEQGHEALYLRKETNIQKEIFSATAFVSGLGYYELTINGTKVGDHLLDPGFTDYNKSVLYTTYDVTSFIKKGINCMGVILGGGWYNSSTPDAWGFQSAPWAAPPKLLLNIVLEFQDGSKSVITSDETWNLSTGPIVFNSVRSNEVYDARLEKPGWNLTGYNDSDWKDAKIVPPPAGNLVSQQLPPIRATQIISPIGLMEPVPGVESPRIELGSKQVTKELSTRLVFKRFSIIS